MSATTKTLLLIAVILGLEAILIVLQDRRMAEVEKLNADMVKRNVALQATVSRLTAKSESISGPPPSAPTPLQPTVSGAKPIGVDKEILKSIHFDLVDENFILTDLAKGALGLTPTEANQAQAVLNEMKVRIQDYQRANLKQVTREQMEEPGNWDYVFEAPGHVTLYQIPEMSDGQRASLQKLFSTNLTSAVGSDRADVMLQRAMVSDALWLGKGEHIELAFRDSATSNAGGPLTEWDEDIYNSSGGSGGTHGQSKGLIAPKWAYLFELAPNGTRVPIAPSR